MSTHPSGGAAEQRAPEPQRTIGLVGATGVGVSAIVGGGIFVLAGVAFSTAGPGAALAFLFNGVIAALTALSFAEMSTAFPESGGAYSFAHRVLSVRAAFGVGWILCFAYIVAAALYALGFGHYAGEAIRGLIALTGASPPDWLTGRAVALLCAFLALGVYAEALTRNPKSSAEKATVGKLALFGVLILAGLWAVLVADEGSIGPRMDPFLPSGFSGILMAMGFCFIAVQGFDLIPTIAGDIKSPVRNIPRAMLWALGIAMVVYLPLLLIISMVGTPGDVGISTLAGAHPETVMALAAEQFMGPIGYWLVVVAAILSTLSALAACLMAASQVAYRMATDRTLPRVLEKLHPDRATPLASIIFVTVVVVLLLILLPDLSAVGAAGSLAFLASFSLAHLTCYLARTRGIAEQNGYLTPFFPIIPVLGGVICIALAVFQAVMVPSAGVICLIWLSVGSIGYMLFFSHRAESVDAQAEARDPHLVKMRGRRPLVLVPIANPATAGQLMALASAVTPKRVGRVLLLTVVRPPERPSEEPPTHLIAAQESLSAAMTRALGQGEAPQALMTVSAEPWPEIARVAELHQCESLLLGLSRFPRDTQARIESLLGQVDCDVLVLRAAPGWNPRRCRRVLVPIGGRGWHDALRARLLGTLARMGMEECIFFQSFPPGTPQDRLDSARKHLRHLGREKVGRQVQVEVVTTEDVPAAIVERAAECDLLLLGLRRLGRRKKDFGPFALRLAEEAETATLLISRRG